MEPIDVLAVAAHPDDAEVGCGGTLAAAGVAGLRVAVVDLTSGEMGTRGTVAERLEERRRAATLLGLCARPLLGLSDAGVGTGPGDRDVLTHEIRRLRPRIVLAPHVEDRHPDHAAAGRLTREACALAGLAKAGHGDPHRARCLLHYMIHTPFEPTIVMDVSAAWERKMAAVTAYDSQFGPPVDGPHTQLVDPSFLETVSARATFYGAMIGVGRGEPFRGAGPIAMAGVSALLAGAPDGRAADRYRLHL